MRTARSIVAIVEARPETVAADYRRLLALADLAAGESSWCVLADATRLQGGRAAPASPAWQLEPVLAAGRGPTPGDVYALDGNGRPAAADRTWAGTLAAAGVEAADARAWQRRRTGTGGLPALAEALREGAEFPRGLTGQPLLVASGVAVGGGWPVAAGLELVARLVAPLYRRRRRFRATGAELMAEALALVQANCELAGSVIDGVRWPVRAGFWRQGCLLGNVLLAGRDPVAVDAVACRLAGADPLGVPWLRLCAERNLGHGDPRRIDVVGRTDLLDLGLDLPPRLLVPAGDGPLPGSAGGGIGAAWWRPRAWRPPTGRPRTTVWDDPLVGSGAEEGTDRE